MEWKKIAVVLRSRGATAAQNFSPAWHTSVDNEQSNDYFRGTYIYYGSCKHVRVSARPIKFSIISSYDLRV